MEIIVCIRSVNDIAIRMLWLECHIYKAYWLPYPPYWNTKIASTDAILATMGKAVLSDPVETYGKI